MRPILVRPILIAALVVGGFLTGGLSLWVFERARREAPTAPVAMQSTPQPAKEKDVLYWYDPMVPLQHFEKPGKSPFMDMQLVPKYASADVTTQDAGTLSIEPRLVQNLGVRTAIATLGRLQPTLQATGSVAFDERAVTVVSASVAAIVERLEVRAPMDPVQAGAPLFTLLAPDWTAAQEEYLGLMRAHSPGLQALTAAARQRLTLLGMSDTRIRTLEKRGIANPRIVISVPRDGVLAELLVREGAAVMPGTPLARINGLDNVWINAAIAERDAAAIVAGDAVTATVQALPGRRFAGHVEALLPNVDSLTRTLTARVVFDNNERLLIPGMFAQLELTPQDDGRECVLVATEAVIATGTREVVIVAAGKGRFRAQEVRVGLEADGQSEILEGLAAGERVVLSGQFLLDSEASLSGALARLGAGSDSDADSDADSEDHESGDPQ